MNRRTLAAVVTGALVVAGCGAEPTRFEDDGIAFTHPSGWEERPEDVEDGLVVSLEGDSGVAGATVRVVAINEPRASGTLGEYGKLIADTRPLQVDGRLVEDAEHDVRGAEAAWRVVVDYYIYPDRDRHPVLDRLIELLPIEYGDDTVVGRIVDVIPVAGDRQYRLTISGPREAIQSEEISKLIDSFEIVSD